MEKLLALKKNYIKIYICIKTLHALKNIFIEKLLTLKNYLYYKIVCIKNLFSLKKLLALKKCFHCKINYLD
jgi:hypothetical protein